MLRLSAACVVGLVLGACSKDDTSASEPAPGSASAAPVVSGPPTVVAEPREVPAGALQYTLAFPDRATHHIDVVARVPSKGLDPVELSMAVWTPGSYLVREFARHVEQFRAENASGEQLIWQKTRKNRWQVRTGGADEIVVRYRLYANELTVRTNFVDDSLAMLNGAPTFFTVVGRTPGFDVELKLPEGWKHSVTGLPPVSGSSPHRYRAESYAQLVDSPIVAGNPARHHFTVGGAVHELTTFGAGKPWDNARAAKDVEKIVRAHIALWKKAPYERYVFLNGAMNAGGGLEHRNSTLMLTSEWAMATRGDYLRWLGLVSHEFFHTWNVKRLRPKGLGPFDYENEVYTRSLWVVEGITSYYDDLMLKRAGLMKRDEYLEALSKQIESLQTTPGRALQPLSASSYDAWIKYYRHDENSANSSVSYYRKGAVVAWLLDARIRAATDGKASLDDLLRSALERFGDGDGYTPAEFRKLTSELAGEDLSAFFRDYVDGTKELDYEPALAFFGLRFREPKKREPDDPVPGWLGVHADSVAGRWLVHEVRADGPAARAGVSAGDELVAIDEYRLSSEALGRQLERWPPKTKISLLVARRGRLKRIDVELGEAPRETWKLEPVDTPSFAQKSRLSAWLGPG